MLIPGGDQFIADQIGRLVTLDLTAQLGNDGDGAFLGTRDMGKG